MSDATRAIASTRPGARGRLDKPDRRAAAVGDDRSPCWRRSTSCSSPCRPIRFRGPTAAHLYVHMAMWLSTFTRFGIVALASLMYLWRRDPEWDRRGRARQSSGSSSAPRPGDRLVWAKPIWGTWLDVGSAVTLTLTFGYLRRVPASPSLSASAEQGAVLSAILGVSGVVDSTHQPSGVLVAQHPSRRDRQREGGSGLADPLMRITLMVTIARVLPAVLLAAPPARLHARREDTVDEPARSTGRARPADDGPVVPLRGTTRWSGSACCST